VRWLIDDLEECLVEVEAAREADRAFLTVAKKKGGRSALR
jgi:hypothetical protein